MAPLLGRWNVAGAMAELAELFFFFVSFFWGLRGLGAVQNLRRSLLCPQVGCMIRRAKQQLAKKMEEWKRQDEVEAAPIKEAAPSEEAAL